MREWTYKLKTFTHSKCALCGTEYDRHALRKNNLCDECNDKPVRSPSTQGLKKDPLYKKTIEYFNHKCAYCQEREIEQVEHFIPLKLNGETSPFNCVPTCRKCNNSKATYENNIPGYDNVKKYLEELRIKYPNYVFITKYKRNKVKKQPQPRKLYYDEFQFSSFSFPGRQYWLEDKMDADIRKNVKAMMLKYGLEYGKKAQQ